VLLISHNIQSVFDLADRVVVFRLGRCIADLDIAETSEEEVVGLIVRGREG
jgi:ABC-type sugar transport system ATPase subunit